MIFTGLVVGSMAATFVLSLATIVYAGPLAAYLEQGIALTLLGSMILGIVGALLVSYRGTIVQPQDVTTILIALAAAGIASNESLHPQAAFSTVIALVISAALATGALAFVMGYFRLGYLVRYVPFPVVSGFLAASGVLIIQGVFGMLTPGAPTGAATAWLVHVAGTWYHWLPWLLLSLLMTFLGRRTTSSMIVPLALLLGLVCFYGALAAGGFSLEEARQRGFMLGPFQDRSFASAISLDLLAHVDWGVLASQAPTVLAVAAVALLGALLNASGLEVAIAQDIDLDRDLRGVGAANMAAAFGGGLVGYHLLGPTLLARRFGATGAASGLSVVTACAVVFFFGAGLLSYFPLGVFAAVIWYLGFELSLTPFIDHGRRMRWLDFAIVIATPAVALLAGFMWAVAFGIVMAVVLFVVAYSRTDAVALTTTVANMRARVERSPQERALLATLGEQAIIHKLRGHLFFGSATRLVDRLTGDYAARRPRIALVDLRRVTGADMSAWMAFERLARFCSDRQIRLILTGVLEQGRHPALAHLREKGVELVEDLDDALLSVEERLLEEAAAAEPYRATEGNPFREEAILAGLARYGQEVELKAGELLIEEGAASDDLIFLVQGRCRAFVKGGQGEQTVSRMLPNAIIGEIAHYAGVPRTASVVAETDIRALRLTGPSLKAMEEGDPALAASFHRSLAAILSRRLMAMTRLLRDADV